MRRGEVGPPVPCRPLAVELDFYGAGDCMTNKFLCVINGLKKELNLSLIIG